MGPHSQDQDSKFMRNMIDEIRDISRRNVSRNKKMTKIRDIVTRKDLEVLTPRQIWDKYNLEAVLNRAYSGAFRMQIKRLRDEVGV